MPFFRRLQKIRDGATLRIYTSIIGIVAVIIVLTGFSYYRQSRSALLGECSALIQESMLQINASIDLTVDNILDISKQIYNDRNLYPLLESEYPQQFDTYSYLMEKLDQIKNSSRYVDSLAFYMEKSNRVMYQDYGVTSEKTFPDTVFLQWYNGSGADITVADTHPLVHRGERKNVFSVFARLPIGENINPNGALIINIRQSDIFRDIIQLQDNSLLFFITDPENRIIFSRDESLLYQNIDELPYLCGVSPGSGYQIREIDGVPCLVVAQHSSARDWTYLMAYPIQKVYSTITNLRILVIAISLLVLLASSFIIFRLISTAFHRYDEVFDIIESKAAVYQNATGNIKKDVLQIFSEREKMQKQWDSVVPLFKEKFYLSLIVQHNRREAILEQAQRLDISLPTDGLILSVLEINDAGKNSGSAYLESLSVISIVESTMSGADCKFFCVEASHKCVVLAASILMEPLLHNLNQIMEQIHARLQVSLSVSVCDQPVPVEELNRAYQMAQQAIRYKIIFGADQIILTSDVHNDAQETYLYPGDQEENLCTLIKAGKRESALSLLQEMFDQLNEQRSYFATQQFILRLNATMMELMEELSFTGGQFTARMNLQNFESQKEIWEYFSSAVSALADRAQQSSDSKMDGYFLKISSFVRENYANNPSIEQLCAYVKLSPTYVNQILRKYTGHSFVQYVNDYRIDQSCTLLRDMNMTIKEISERLGFGSAKYYIKLFKDSKGLTPGEYRKQFTLSQRL